MAVKTAVEQESTRPAPSPSATLNAQFWLSQFPWRPTAGWAAVAALLAAGFPTDPFLVVDWRAMALLLLLVDPLWGSVWRLAAGRATLLPLTENVLSDSVWLPYLTPGSPAAMLLGRSYGGLLPILFRVALPSVLLAGAIALVLGVTAVGATLAVVLLSVGGWLGSRYLGAPPALLHSTVTITLPWLLALSLLGIGPDAARWPVHVALVAVWTLHNWGEGRLQTASGDRAGELLLATADLALLALLVIAKAPLWLAPLAVLLLPTWLTIWRGGPVRRVSIWWLFAMLLSAAALG